MKLRVTPKFPQESAVDGCQSVIRSYRDRALSLRLAGPTLLPKLPRIRRNATRTETSATARDSETRRLLVLSL